MTGWWIGPVLAVVSALLALFVVIPNEVELRRRRMKAMYEKAPATGDAVRGPEPRG